MELWFFKSDMRMTVLPIGVNDVVEGQKSVHSYCRETLNHIDV